MEMSAENVARSDDWVMDTLSDVLRSVQLSGVVLYDSFVAAPWAVDALPGRELAADICPGSKHVMNFHVMLEGTCWASLAGEPPVRLEAGDVIMFPKGEAHTLSSAPGLRGTEDRGDVGHGAPAPTRLPIRWYGGPPRAHDAHFVCGFWSCDIRPFNPLVGSLPRMLVDTSGRSESQGWIGALMRQAVTEAHAARPGTTSVLTKLSEVMFIEVIRRHLESLPPERRGWLLALRDPVVGKAISMMHARPAEEWTLERLARACGASRSVLAERFTEHMRMPPMQYLAQWRMQISAGLLERTDLGLAAIAAEVGYQSEAAFHRTFKRVVGESPGLYRRRIRTGDTAIRRTG